MSADIPVITVDGPGGAGKGELCLRLSKMYGFTILDSGAIYRVLAYAALKHQVSLADEPSLVKLAGELRLSFEPRDSGVAVMLDGEDVSRGIRNEETGGAASKIAALPGVRAALLDRQKACRTAPGLVADGRDMGTVVFPDAPVKIFLDASPEERARRRVKQLESQGKAADYDKILAEIRERDNRDRNRAAAPLKPAPDALLLDSTELSIQEVVDTALAFAAKKLKPLS
ncbi:(d)CMP kinase [Succinimonas sp.]|uniref:(d)CMP kinase n=1 Tax=Succinimonas sp. TaxID=1936151 RepID=UPI0038638764